MTSNLTKMDLGYEKTLFVTQGNIEKKYPFLKKLEIKLLRCDDKVKNTSPTEPQTKITQVSNHESADQAKDTSDTCLDTVTSVLSTGRLKDEASSSPMMALRLYRRPKNPTVLPQSCGNALTVSPTETSFSPEEAVSGQKQLQICLRRCDTLLPMFCQTFPTTASKVQNCGANIVCSKTVTIESTTEKTYVCDERDLQSKIGKRSQNSVRVKTKKTVKYTSTYTFSSVREAQLHIDNQEEGGVVRRLCGEDVTESVSTSTIAEPLRWEAGSGVRTRSSVQKRRDQVSTDVKAKKETFLKKLPLVKTEHMQFKQFVHTGLRSCCCRECKTSGTIIKKPSDNTSDNRVKGGLQCKDCYTMIRRKGKLKHVQHVCSSRTEWARKGGTSTLGPLEQTWSSQQSSKKPYKCGGVCDTFDRSNKLKRHLPNHLGSKPFKCVNVGEVTLKGRSVEEMYAKLWQCDSNSERSEEHPQMLRSARMNETGGAKSIATSEQSWYCCEECDEKFLSSWTLLEHYGVHKKYVTVPAVEEPLVCKTQMSNYSKEKPYQCKECTSMFMLRCDLNTHVALHHNMALEWLDDGEALTQHNESVSPITCGLLSPRYDTDMEEYAQTYGLTNLWTCMSPGYSSNTIFGDSANQSSSKANNSSEVVLRMEHVMHEDKFSAIKKTQICNECGAAFSTARGLVKHVRVQKAENGRFMCNYSRKRRFQCKECPAAFSVYCGLKHHMGLNHTEPQQWLTDVDNGRENLALFAEGTEIMQVCNDYSSQATDVQFHSHCDSSTSASEETLHRCNRVDTISVAEETSSTVEFYSRQKLVRKCTMKYTQDTEECVNKVKQSYKCKKCTSTFSTKQSLEVHLCKASRDESFSCRNCGSIFITNESLWQHNFKCPRKSADCGSPFKRKKLSDDDMLKSHVHVSTRKRLFKLAVYDKSFIKNGKLQRDVHTHIPKRPFRCGICKEYFKKSRKLKRHVVIHIGRMYRCGICGHAFDSNGKLKRHIRTHMGQSLFFCGQCFRRFGTNGKLKKHMRNHRGTVASHCGLCSVGFRKNADLKKHMLHHFGKKSYRCGACNDGFHTNGRLKRHVRTHTGEKLFQCGHCDENFNTNGKLKRHVRIGNHEKRPTRTEKRHFVPRAKRQVNRVNQSPLGQAVVRADAFGSDRSKRSAYIRGRAAIQMMSVLENMDDFQVIGSGR